jgi:hypothetical protein
VRACVRARACVNFVLPSHFLIHKKEMTIIMYCHCCQHFFVLFVITFMQGIFNYIPQTGHVSRVYSVASLLYSQFIVVVVVLLLL